MNTNLWRILDCYNYRWTIYNAIGPTTDTKKNY